MNQEPMRPYRRVLGGMLEPPTRFRLPLLLTLGGMIILLTLALVLLAGWWFAQQETPLSLTHAEGSIPPNARIAVDPPAGEAGTLLRVSGQGWTGGDVVFVSLEAPFAESGHDFAFGGAVAGEDGRFTVSFTYPATDPWAGAGAVKIVAWADKTGAKAVTIFQALAPTPTTEAQPESVARNSVQVSGPLKASAAVVAETQKESEQVALAASTRVPPPAEHWYGQYFAGIEPGESPLFVRDDPEIRFDWGDQPPGVRIDSNAFSARWTRQVYFAAGVYRFFATADDGVRVWVDGALIIDQWHLSSPTTYVGDRYLWQGNHEMRVEYFERAGQAAVHVWWERQEVYPDWKGEYFNGRMPDSSPDAVRNDARLRFNWGNQPPVPGFRADDFSARWTRRVRLEGGVYRFYVRGDDGIRVWLDNSPVIDLWENPGSGLRTVDLTLADSDYSVHVEYYNRGGSARVEFRWERLSPTPKALQPLQMAAAPIAARPRAPAVPNEITVEPVADQPIGSPDLAVRALALPAESVPQEATLDVEPEQAQPGSVLTVRGAGWPAGSEVNFLLADAEVQLPVPAQQGQTLTAATVGDDGTFEAALVFTPEGEAAGAERVQLVAYLADWSLWSTHSIRQASITPAAPAAGDADRSPTLDVSPADVTPGGGFVVSGQNWRPADQVIVALVKPGEELQAAPPFAQAIVDEQGSFQLSLTLPDDPQWTEFPELIVVTHSIDWTIRLVSPLRVTHQ